MQPLPLPAEYSVFVDTSAIWNENICVVPLPDFPTTLSRVRFYVSQLVVEERAVQLLHDFKKATAALDPFACVGVSAQLSIEPDLAFFRTKVVEGLKGRLRHSQLEVFEPISHDVDLQKLLFEQRHRGAYKDTILFGSAVQLAEARELKNCILVASDKGFPDLVRLLATRRRFELHRTISELQERLQFDQEIYHDIIATLMPQLERYAANRRAELVARGGADSSVFGPIMHTERAEITQPDFDLAKLSFEVRDLSVGGIRIPDAGTAVIPTDTKHYRPAEVLCRMTVHYWTAGWSRLYEARAQANLHYGEHKLDGAEVTQFDLACAPFA